MEISPMVAADVATCLRLYRLNEPGRFPPNFIGEYERTLRAKGTAFLVARVNGELVGSAGLMMAGDVLKRGIGLVFGLVHPAWQHRGVGSSLLLARLAALPEPQTSWAIALSAVDASRSFYEQYGFRFAGRFPNCGVELDHFAAALGGKEWRLCRAILTEAGVTPATQQLIWR